MANNMHLLERNPIVSTLRSTMLGTLVIAVSTVLSLPALAFGQDRQAHKHKKPADQKHKATKSKTIALSRHNHSAHQDAQTKNKKSFTKKSTYYKSKKSLRATAHRRSHFAWQAIEPNNAQEDYNYAPNDLTDQKAIDVATTDTPKSNAKALQIGTASFYSDKFNGGRTASGERLDQKKLTCAHGSLPFGCRIRVTNLNNNRSVEVKVNDRGGFSKHGRVLDLTKAAASQIGMLGAGTARVKVEKLD